MIDNLSLIKKVVYDALDAGIYVASVHNPDGTVYERDNYGDGWNDACFTILEQVGNALDSIPSMSDDLSRLLAGEYCRYFNGSLLLNLNDIFYYASADCEKVEDSEIPELSNLARRYGWAGAIYWASEKRNHLMPEIPRYRKMVEMVIELEGQK